MFLTENDIIVLLDALERAYGSCIRLPEVNRLYSKLSIMHEAAERIRKKETKHDGPNA